MNYQEKYKVGQLFLITGLLGFRNCYKNNPTLFRVETVNKKSLRVSEVNGINCGIITEIDILNEVEEVEEVETLDSLLLSICEDIELAEKKPNTNTLGNDVIGNDIEDLFGITQLKNRK